MPTYEYECTKCGHLFEKFQGINDKPVSKCPRCKGKVKRLISGGSGLLFKGSGFYITDYRGKDYKDKAKAEKGGGEKSGGDKGGGDKGSKGSDKPAPKKSGD